MTNFGGRPFMPPWRWIGLAPTLDRSAALPGDERATTALAEVKRRTPPSIDWVSSTASSNGMERSGRVGVRARPAPSRASH